MTSDDRFARTLRAARAGEGWALSELYRELQPRILRYLRAFEPAEAEDLSSDVWLDVSSGLDRFDGVEQAFRAWAFTIARRRLVDLRRRRARQATHPVPNEDIPEHATSADVEDEVLAALGTEAALSRIASLPPDQAEVVLLRVLAGISVRDVAAIMDKRPGTVRVLQHRALRALASQVAREPVTE
jgi:RNA polymerase sigma-70 factor (ECF subfamily)